MYVPAPGTVPRSNVSAGCLTVSAIFQAIFKMRIRMLKRLSKQGQRQLGSAETLMSIKSNYDVSRSRVFLHQSGHVV